MTTPLQNLPTVRCQDCSWERRPMPDTVPVLVLAGLAHMTETDGHQVVFNDAKAA